MSDRPANNEDPDLPPLGMTPFWRFGQQVCRFVNTVLFDLKCYDMHNLPLEGGVLMLANHQSFLDPTLAACRVNRPVCFLARASLFKPPIFGPIIRGLHTYPVERGKANVGIMKKMINIVDKGRALLLFPEGTRSEDGKLRKFESGMALIIKKAKVPVVPIAIDGSYKVWPRHRMFPTAGHVRVKYGKPMLLHELDNKLIMGSVETEIRRLLGELQEMGADAAPRM